jgi:hypothetical protein
MGLRIYSDDGKRNVFFAGSYQYFLDFKKWILSYHGSTKFSESKLDMISPSHPLYSKFKSGRLSRDFQNVESELKSLCEKKPYVSSLAYGYSSRGQERTGEDCKNILQTLNDVSDRVSSGEHGVLHQSFFTMKRGLEYCIVEKCGATLY